MKWWVRRPSTAAVVEARTRAETEALREQIATVRERTERLRQAADRIIIENEQQLGHRNHHGKHAQ